MTRQQQVERLLDQHMQPYLRLGVDTWWQARRLALQAARETMSKLHEPAEAGDFFYEAVLAIEAMQLQLPAGAV